MNEDQSQKLTREEEQLQKIVHETMKSISLIERQIERLEPPPALQLNPPGAQGGDRGQLQKDAQKLRDNIEELKEAAITRADKIINDLPKEKQESVKADIRSQLKYDDKENAELMQAHTAHENLLSSRFMAERKSSYLIMADAKESSMPSRDTSQKENSFAEKYSSSLFYSNIYGGIEQKNPAKEIEQKGDR